MNYPTLPPFARDKWIMLFGSLLVSQLFIAVGTQESWLVLTQQENYLADTMFTTTLSILLWFLVRSASGYLQRNYDWLKHPLRRISLQLLLGLTIPVVLCAACVMVYYNLYYGVPIAKTSFPAYEFPLSVILVVQYNLYYLIYYFYKKAKSQEDGPPPENVSSRKALVGSLGRKNVPIELTQIAHISIKDSIVYVTTFDGNRLSVGYSLEEVYNFLDTSKFYRTNRQVIINRKSCKSFLSEANGKLLVEVDPPMEEKVVISQLKAPDFKKWIEAG